MKVLMIEDDLELSEMIIRYLKAFDIQVINTDSPQNGLSMLQNREYKLLILDLTLPDTDGLDLLEDIRQISDIPIIISSARDDIVDKVLGFDKGADDYLPKPYNPRELQIRIKSLLKRKQPTLQEKDTGHFFEIFSDKKEIHFQKIPLKLTAAEYDILELLIRKNGAVVSREECLYYSENIDDESSPKNIDVIISRLRQKLSKIETHRQIVQSVRGTGYKLNL